jgi:hypothetical protein
MKKRNLLLTCLVVLGLTAAFAEQTNKPTPAGEAAVVLTRFNLDFPGGMPKELVAAIQKAMGKPLNAIIPEEDAGIILPPLKMNNVDAPRLFLALKLASIKTVAHVTASYYGAASPYAYGAPSPSYERITTSYGFRTEGTPTDDSIWFFSIESPSFPPLIQNKVCRFYLLTPYLDRGLTVDDITTAIQTGWKMLGDKETPTISFHKETQLLIAVGEASKLETINAVLKALEAPKVKREPDIDPETGLPLPKVAPKAKP